MCEVCLQTFKTRENVKNWSIFQDLYKLHGQIIQESLGLRKPFYKHKPLGSFSNLN